MYPQMPNHKLGTLVKYLSLPTSGDYHRALADAEMTAHLLARILSDLENQLDASLVSHQSLTKLQRVSKKTFAATITRMNEKKRKDTANKIQTEEANV
jgi:DNA polymerase-3 subunit epsilon